MISNIGRNFRASISSLWNRELLGAEACVRKGSWRAPCGLPSARQRRRSRHHRLQSEWWRPQLRRPSGTSKNGRRRFLRQSRKRCGRTRATLQSRSTRRFRSSSRSADRKSPRVKAAHAGAHLLARRQNHRTEAEARWARELGAERKPKSQSVGRRDRRNARQQCRVSYKARAG
jgi:hypothetical protein